MTNLHEKWLPITNFENKYEVSDFGRIRNSNTLQVLKLYNQNGYNYTYLSISKTKGLRPTVHRLVAIHFIYNPDNKPCVNHIDCNRSNNHISNLEWVTHKENTDYGIRYGNIKQFQKGLSNVANREYVRKKISEGLSGSKHYKAKVIVDTATGAVYGCIQEAANANNISREKLKHYLKGSCKNKTTLQYAA